VSGEKQEPLHPAKQMGVSSDSHSSVYTSAIYKQEKLGTT
jgi:hypothetical protein